MNRFFIDECLSASLVALAKERGLAADYGPHIGMAGWQDWNIARFAFENGYVVVTNNRRDFLREYLKHELHHGLIVVVPHPGRRQQIDLFSRVLDRLAKMDGPPDNHFDRGPRRWLDLHSRVDHSRSWHRSYRQSVMD